MPGSWTRAEETWVKAPAVLSWLMLIAVVVTLQPGQYWLNWACAAATMPGTGSRPFRLTIRTFALPCESLMIQSASAAPAIEIGALTTAVTPAAQPAQAGGSGIETS